MRDPSMHSAAWWRRHWERTGIVIVERADTMAEGWRQWLEWQRTVSPNNHVEMRAVEADGGHFLGYVRVVGRRQADARLEEPIGSIPTQYTMRPLLRGEG
jgi:hypothetical protein